MRQFGLKSAAEAWGTRDEIAFIVGLGVESEILPVRQVEQRWRVAPDRKTLLRNYMKAAERRERWGDINKQICLLVAALLLEGQE